MRRICLYLFASLLIPYVITLAWTGSPGGLDGVGLGWKHSGFQEESSLGNASGRSILLDGHSGEYVDVETYLVGVTARQISAEYELEAVKAQAIIARTYVLGKMGEALEIPESELGMQAFGQTQMELLWGKEEFLEYYEKIKRAVAETNGQVLLVDVVDGKREQSVSHFLGETTDTQEEAWMPNPLFHPISSGYTRDGGEAYPYLRMTESSHDLEADGYLTVLEWTPLEFVKLLAPIAAVESVQARENLQLVAKDRAGYVKEYQIGSHIFTGEQLMQALKLPSTAFSLSDHEGQIRAVCKGVGHGYGLSQYGAHRMAMEGKTAEEILCYYYQNVSVISVDS